MIDGNFCVRKAFDDIQRASAAYERQNTQRKQREEEYDKTVLLKLMGRFQNKKEG
jgi:hypothetical protein